MAGRRAGPYPSGQFPSSASNGPATSVAVPIESPRTLPLQKGYFAPADLLYSYITRTAPVAGESICDRVYAPWHSARLCPAARFAVEFFPCNLLRQLRQARSTAVH